ALEEFGRFQQRLGRGASGGEARGAERIGSVGGLPFIDAGHGEFVLTRTNGGGITSRAGAYHHDIDNIAHTRSTMRAGSSRHCLTVTKNCTASRPSMIRG